MNKSWKIDPASRDYVMANGAPVETTRLLEPAFIRLRSPRRGTANGSGWMYAPDAEWGSDLRNIKKRSSNDPTQVELAAGRALKPMLDDQRALEIDVTTTGQARHGVQLEVAIVDAAGQIQEFKFESLGV